MPISKNSPPIFQHYNGKWRPLWRGRVHGIAALVAIPAGTLLILAAESAIARVATSIYVFSLFALYSTSASYHLFTRAPHVQKIMQKLDHSMIFILIAGTYTPLCLLALPHSWGIPFLCFVWVAAIMGMVFKFGWGARIG
jgi:hemolysin III